MTGIYKIINKFNNKIYIGQAFDFDKRKLSHKHSFISFSKNPKNHKSGCRLLYNAFKKYGFENFVFELIEECAINYLNDREQFWMDYYKSYEKENGYNLSKIAGSSLGTKRSEETKKKLSEIASKRTGSKNSFFGKTHTTISKEKIRIKKTGSKMPPEFLVKWSKHKIWELNKKRILQYNIWGDFLKEWNSLNDVFYMLNIKPGRVSECLHNKQKTAGGYIWKYYEENYLLKIDASLCKSSFIRNFNKYYK